jgi:hypothetical protein
MLAATFCLAAVACTSAAAVPPDGPPGQTSAYDASAFLVPASQVNNLSALIKLHTVVRLEAADYTASCHGSSAPSGSTCANVTLVSGAMIYGLPGTVIPTVVVPPGSTGIMLTTLGISGLLYFPPSTARTTKCSFFRLAGPHILFDGAAVRD